MQTLEDLKNYLIEEAEMKPAKAEAMDSRELVEAYCQWNGLIGFADEIIDVVLIAYHKTRNDR